MVNYLNCEFDDLSDHLAYVSNFFNLKFDYAPPVLVKENEDGESRSVPYEEFLQVQTHNPYNISSVEKILVIRNQQKDLNNNQIYSNDGNN